MVEKESYPIGFLSGSRAEMSVYIPFIPDTRIYLCTDELSAIVEIIPAESMTGAVFRVNSSAVRMELPHFPSIRTVRSTASL